MADSTVQAERSLAVNAGGDRLWSLLSTPAALFLRPDRPAGFAFEIPWSPQGAGRLCLYVGRSNRGVQPVVFAARDEVPGHMVCWQTISTRPPSRQAYTLRVLEDRRGTVASVAIKLTVPRAQRPSGLWLRRDMESWLSELRAVVEGRAPWPGPAMLADAQRAWPHGSARFADDQVSAAALVYAPISVVWEAIWSPENGARLNPERGAACAGHVPGTPERAVGEMQYSVQQHADGRVTAGVIVVKEFADNQHAVVERIGPPYDRTTYSVETAPAGTRLELASELPIQSPVAGHLQVREAMAAHLQTTVAGYKTMIEESVRST